MLAYQWRGENESFVKRFEREHHVCVLGFARDLRLCVIGSSFDNVARASDKLLTFRFPTVPFGIGVEQFTHGEYHMLANLLARNCGRDSVHKLGIGIIKVEQDGSVMDSRFTLHPIPLDVRGAQDRNGARRYISRKYNIPKHARLSMPSLLYFQDNQWTDIESFSLHQCNRTALTPSAAVDDCSSCMSQHAEDRPTAKVGGAVDVDMSRPSHDQSNATTQSAKDSHGEEQEVIRRSIEEYEHEQMTQGIEASSLSKKIETAREAEKDIMAAALHSA